ncbi:ketoacyl-synt-domain-containing protein [Aspergillus minisclerotigenes]|uniref:Ketoacyl-synt-domain-containing protein n=1 Tax=Aspergillus minisclerotigenes TaxID=656917 RepID=A0A5N6IP36_9EURO|nr:ketoacyl-synt-domain-containing protein [Aspergillus minisclerotigenes]
MEPIAVVGMSCRFAGEASNVEKFWRLLCEARSAWSKTPEGRFQETSFFHPDSRNNGTFYHQGGHFMSDDISKFDANFFQISSSEAKAMDPQQRLLLELAFEAFENGGMTLDKLRGTDTASYVALYNKDYERMLFRDPQNLPFYERTGNGDATFANRLSYFFDLKGPSIALDTGCSGSLVALHLACQTIRDGEARQAIVGASNLILDPATMVAGSFLNFFSPDGKSKAFDSKADGYGRGEGAACVIIKSLSQAIKDQDPIRAVIRGSAINQDGRTLGITAPNPVAQEELIRKAYSLAGLDMANTSYVEAHGTGTSKGDLTEARGIGATIGKARKGQGPVICGSVKTNIGHLENAAGLAGFVKAVLIVETGVIPPNINFERLNPSIRALEWNLSVPTAVTRIDQNQHRQVSVNSFGYGGTNAHVVLTSWQEQDSASNNDMDDEAQLTMGTNDHEYVVPFSAQSAQACPRLLVLIREFLDCKSKKTKNESALMRRLVHTLCDGRTKFQWRVAVVASSIASLINALSRELTPIHSIQPSSLIFIFSGQGSQWYGMGRDLLTKSRIYKSSIGQAEKLLWQFGVGWKLTEELCRPEKETRLLEAHIAQPACTAVQVALVDVLRSWRIAPHAVVGHSSGEIAAAYACEAVSFEDALWIAYTRGQLAEQLVQHQKTPGAMMAVALSNEDALAYISDPSIARHGSVQISCINSPCSITMSGDKFSIDALWNTFQEKGVLARRLDVPVAYHSHHVSPIADAYMQKLEERLSAARSNPDTSFFSSVEGTWLDSAELTPQYWVKNLISPVLFSQALEEAISTYHDTTLNDCSLTSIVEIGPQATLRRPVQQLLESLQVKGETVKYLPSLTKHLPANTTMTHLASELFTAGHAVNLDQVNFGDSPSFIKEILQDLPAYPWDHRLSYWHESRLSRNYRQTPEPRHDLLGFLSNTSSSVALRWRNYLRASELQWLTGHMVDSQMIYPAAAFLSMAFEAGAWYASHVLGLQESDSLASIELSQISVHRSVIIPKGGDGVEIEFELRPSVEYPGRDLAGRHEFIICSSSESDNTMAENCRGFITFSKEPVHADQYMPNLHFEETDVSTMYKWIATLGVEYRDKFRAMTSAKAGRQTSEITITPHQIQSLSERFTTLSYLHPATVDASIQSIYPVLMNLEGVNGPVLPTFIGRVSINVTMPLRAVEELQVQCHVRKASGTKYSTDVQCSLVEDTDRRKIIRIEGLEVTCTGRKLLRSETQKSTEAGQRLEWILDPDLLGVEAITRECFSALPQDSVSAHIQTLESAALHFIRRALADISDTDRESITGHRKAHLEWMECIAEQKKEYVLDEKALRALQMSGSEGRFIYQVGSHLANFFKGTADPLSVMTADNLLYDYYHDCPSLRRCSIQAGLYIRMFGEKHPNIDILEIGAGTAATTLPVLQALTDLPGGRSYINSYTVTDISVGFFPQVKEKLSEWGSLLDYGKLDISEDPHLQGFQGKTYDIVVASNVLHATEHIDVTLSHVRKLLKPGGRLVLLESTRSFIHRDMTFGALPGWWLGAMQRQKNTPLLSVDEWKSALLLSGFSGIDTCTHSYAHVDEQLDSLIVSTATSSRGDDQDPFQIVLSHSQYQKYQAGEASYSLSKILSALGKEAGDVVPPGDPSLRGRRCLYLAELQDLLWRTCEDHDMNGLKETIHLVREIVYLSRGATMECANPDSSLAIGLLRTLRNEYPNVNFQLIDLDYNTDGTVSEQNINDLVTFLRKKDSLFNADEHEWTVRGRNWYVPRIVPHSQLNAILCAGNSEKGPKIQSEPFFQDDKVLRLQADEYGILESLHFVEDEAFDGPLPADEVEILPKYSGINFRDLMISLGQLESAYLGECSGVVVKVGQSLKDKFQVNDRVYTWCGSAYSSRIRSKGIWTRRIPDSLSFSDAATLPVVYGTAYYSLVNVAALERGEAILIHSAAGGVGQAAIILAQHLGAEIFATVGSQQKKEFLIDKYGLRPDHIFSSRSGAFVTDLKRINKGSGVHVVLNCLSGARIQDSLDVLEPLGRFVEIGKRDMITGARMDMGSFQKSISLTAVDLSSLATYKPHAAVTLFSKVYDLIEEGTFYPPSPVQVFPVSQLKDAFRLMQAGKHMGKLVVSYDTKDKVMVKDTGVPRSAKFRPDSTYVVCGGQGGIGRALCKWMSQRGAKHIVILSPSGAEKPTTQRLIAELANDGCKVRALSCDIGDREMLESIIATCTRELPPIRGVIQAALVLRDTVFDQMTAANYHAVLKPKLAGTLHIHELLKGHLLDFFVILSSYTGLIGNPGQANYTSASTFQDSFAHWRTGQGLPTYSIDLGVVLDAGYVHEHVEVQEHLAKMGGTGISLATLIKVVNYAICNPPSIGDSSQIAVGWSLGDQSSKSHILSPDARFVYMETGPQPQSGKETSISSPNAEITVSSEKIKSQESLMDASRLIINAITAQVSIVMGTPLEDVDTEKSIAAHGGDSLVAAEFRNWFWKTLGVTVNVGQILGSTSIRELAEMLAHDIRSSTRPEA